jgi:hypothetical protein
LFLGSFVACKKDTDPTPDESGMEGSWQITSITIKPAQNGISDALAFYNGFAGNQCLSTIRFSFKTRGKIETVVPSGCEGAKAAAEIQLGLNDSTTWKTNGDKLTLTSTSTNEYTFKVDGSIMNWTYTTVDASGANYTYLFVFKRA